MKFKMNELRCTGGTATTPKYNLSPHQKEFKEAKSLFAGGPVKADYDKCYLPSPMANLYLRDPPFMATSRSSHPLFSHFSCYHDNTVQGTQWLHSNKNLLQHAADMNVKTNELILNQAEKKKQAEIHRGNLNHEVSTKALQKRVTELQDFSTKYFDMVKKMQNERVMLDNTKLRIKRFEVCFKKIQCINSECVMLRCQVPYSELYRDDVALELYKEQDLIMEISEGRQAMFRLINETEANNLAATEAVEVNWSQKFNAHKLDDASANMNKTTKTLITRTVPCHLSQTETREEQWRWYSRALYEDCVQVYNDSASTREKVENFLSDSVRRLCHQAAVVSKLLTVRVSCLDQLLERLTMDLQRCLHDLSVTENQIHDLQLALIDAKMNTKVLHGRLHLRSQRESIENVADHVQERFSEEKHLNQGSISAIKHLIAEAEEHKNNLRSLRERFQREIMWKRRAHFQDRERCGELRKAFPTEQELVQIINA